ncbi:unnamed protein product [Didymodactylos carnosus]|uniref:HAT C-terminal dimerisation domain-containing protein n=2 Tax=Didymodactylos carnosus TaxID=1234261 RepID=A0A816DIY3_9BILA|nr:unnamed protein product [Didymodactylos carnosus]
MGNERSKLEREIKQIYKDMMDGRDDSETATVATPPSQKPKQSATTSVTSFLQAARSSNSSTQKARKSCTISEQLAVYRSLATAEFVEICDRGKKPDVMLFWQSNIDKIPFLAKLAKRYLATPSTSVPSESAFSMAGYLARKQRARLTPQNLSDSVFLKDKFNADSEDSSVEKV